MLAIGLKVEEFSDYRSCYQFAC